MGDPAIALRNGSTLIFSAFGDSEAGFTQTQGHQLAGPWQGTPEAAFTTASGDQTLVTSPVAEIVTDHTGSTPETFMMVRRDLDGDGIFRHENAMFVRRPDPEWTTNTVDWPQPP
jgi:hypothetical protein